MCNVHANAMKRVLDDFFLSARFVFMATGTDTNCVYMLFIRRGKLMIWIWIHYVVHNTYMYLVKMPRCSSLGVAQQMFAHCYYVNREYSIWHFIPALRVLRAT